jgi:hypothetical protein
MRWWTLLSRGYAVAAIAIMVAIEIWHWARPDFSGIPGWLFPWVPIPMWGIFVLPACLIVELILRMSGRREQGPFWRNVALLVAATLICAWGYRN